MLNFSAGAWSLDGCDFWTLLSSGSRCGGRFFFFCDLSMYGHEHLSTRARFPGTIEMTLNREKKLWMAAIVVLEKLALGFLFNSYWIRGCLVC